MECPVCREKKYSGDWSRRQWEANGRKGSPFVVVDGWQRMCSRQCSEIEEYYFRATPAETERGSQPSEPKASGAADSKSEEGEKEEEDLRLRLASPLNPPLSAT